MARVGLHYRWIYGLRSCVLEFVSMQGLGSLCCSALQIATIHSALQFPLILCLLAFPV